jgi:SAM-dependent methyltransferase
VEERVPNAERFSAGFADLYNAARPAPPPELGVLLRSYANVVSPSVVDLGSGTGLSTRWAASWAAEVVGIEPSDEMRAEASRQPLTNVTYRPGVSHATGLPSASADIVTAVQAMHWMEPEPTLAEVARLLRPGGVFAVIDADWPPVSGVAGAEAAWRDVHRRIRVFEARAALGMTGPDLARPVDDDDPSLVDEDLHDPHRRRSMPGGARSWSKSGHLERIERSRLFDFTREVLFQHAVPGGADRFVDIMRSQGSYQGLRKLGMTDDEIGLDAFVSAVDLAFDAAVARPATLSFSWRARIGVRPRA